MRFLSDLNSGRLLAAGLGLALVAMVAVAAGYLTREQERHSLEVAAPPAGVEYVRGVVQSVTADSITLLTDAGPATVRLTPATRREAVETIGLSQVRPGDWVNAGGVGHAQTIYVLTALVVIPAENVEGR
ncbi:MAG TPA: hypothetical protein VNN10_01015 [Dehalococcoidia bacterium]|nr:hypothetical protein [Dehalococcoidia bacterium]